MNPPTCPICTSDDVLPAFVPSMDWDYAWIVMWECENCEHRWRDGGEVEGVIAA